MKREQSKPCLAAWWSYTLLNRFRSPIAVRQRDGWLVRYMIMVVVAMVPVVVVVEEEEEEENRFRSPIAVKQREGGGSLDMSWWWW